MLSKKMFGRDFSRKVIASVMTLSAYWGISSFLPCIAGATVVTVNNYGYAVDIIDSSVYMRGKCHANVLVRPKMDQWKDAYPVEVFWGKGYAVYVLDNNGNRITNESDEFALAIANYMSEHY